MAIVRAAGPKALPAVVRKMEEDNDHFKCEAMEDEYWQPLVEAKYRSRPVEAPYPVLKAKAEVARDALSATMDTKPWEISELSMTWGARGCEQLAVLERIPMTVGHTTTPDP